MGYLSCALILALSLAFFTDPVTSPDKNTWGLTYDDGPAPYTPDLLKFLDEKQLKSTFFVVGSRVLSFPSTLQYEYMAGHQISIHTWSHRQLTTLTNEQVRVLNSYFCRHYPEPWHTDHRRTRLVEKDHQGRYRRDPELHASSLWRY